MSYDYSDRMKRLFIGAAKDHRPERLAELFAFTCYFQHSTEWYQHSFLLRYYRDDYYLYRGGRYELWPMADLEASLWDYLAKLQRECPDIVEIKQITRNLTGDILYSVQYTPELFIPSESPVPCWLGKPELRPTKNPLIALRNGLLDWTALLNHLSHSEPPDPAVSPLRERGVDDPGLTSGANTRAHFFEHTPLWFNLIQLPYDFLPQADCPTWKAFLEQIFEGDAERIELLREWFGYCLTPDTQQQKFLLAVGEGANGKSVVFTVLAKLLGDENVSHVPLERFGGEFGLADTVNKLANIVSEVGPMDKVAEGRVKEFVGGDRMNLGRKYKEDVVVRPTARLCLATNTPPRFADRSQGIWRRMLYLPFNITIPVESQNPHLADDLCQELSGIFNWALQGLGHLHTRKRFAEPAACAAAKRQYQLDCDPTREFLLDHYISSPYGSIETQTLYTHYCTWMLDHGHHPLGARTFGKELRKLFPSVERVRVGATNQRSWLYTGLSIQE